MRYSFYSVGADCTTLIRARGGSMSIGNMVYTRTQIHDLMDALDPRQVNIGVWAEFRDGGIAACAIDRFYTNGKPSFVGVWGATDEDMWLPEREYGKTWRAWAKKPTRKEMNNTPWGRDDGVERLGNEDDDSDNPDISSRPLTLSEAKQYYEDHSDTNIIGVWAWTEERPVDDGKRYGLLFRSVVDEDFSNWHGRQRGLVAVWGACGVSDDEYDNCFFEERDYGRKWRMWDHMPTVEEMSAAPWPICKDIHE